MAVLRRKTNFTEGPIFSRLLVFVIPIVLTGLLQVAYGMADNIVVGNFSGDPDALAALGQASSYNNLIINLYLGISIGSGVVVAQLFGAGDKRELSNAVHSSMLLSVIVGVLLMGVGLLITKPVLSLIVKPALLEKSTLYMTIICLGLPASSVYNFGASILRSIGDSKRPLIILSLSGLLNVLFNLVFVLCFGMAVEGVAIATIISQYASAIAVVILLLKEKDESVRLSLKKLAIYKKHLTRILYCGVPAGLQNAAFSFANMLFTSAISTFPNETITGNTIAGSIDAITFTCMSAFTTSMMTFAGQNYGARKKERLKKGLLYSVIQVSVVGITVSVLELLLAHPLINLFIGAADGNKAQIISEAGKIMQMMLPLYFLCGIMNVLMGYLRGLGMSTGPMLSSVISVLTVRGIWIFFFFPLRPDSVQWLYICFPIAWVTTIIANVILIIYKHSIIKKSEAFT